ncbi:uncharacterized protein LOC119361889 [Triticum dicoccoides]|uniref:uncharacterized protein LOC119361889 n=1 Tax=Triticum dicoccoides TaxID=85692 RepID=UPI00188F902E|nr:uncharacterized protein LOC119361889 [Triticum dicoccoides]
MSSSNIQMGEMSTSAGDSCEEALLASAQDDLISNLPAEGLPPSSDMPYARVQIKTILDTVEKGGLMDDDTLDFAIRNMAREKSSDGGLKKSKYSCRKHYITSYFAVGATRERNNDNVNDPEVDPFFNKDFECMDASESNNIDVLCIPVNHLCHWTLYAYDMKNDKLSILDSKENYSRHEGIPYKIGKALERVQKDYGLFKNKSNFSLWPHVFPRVPQQGYGTNDCGFFVFKFMCHWNGHKLTGLISRETMDLRNEFLAYIHSFNINEAGPVEGVALEKPQEWTRDISRPPEATIAIIPTTTRAIDSTSPSLYKVAPITKILVEPCMTLKSPFLVKRKSFGRPDTKILEDLYQDIITDKLHIWQGPEDIQKLMKDGQKVDALCLNLVVSNMRKVDAHDFKNTKCMGWRHYVDSDWAVKSLSGYSNPIVLKNIFYRGSAMYNASRSHMVFIPVVIHGDHWTLYAFNMYDQKLSILDSLSDTIEGVDDPVERHQKTRHDVCDALTTTMNFTIDFRSWEYEFPKLPRQQNSYDSGFFVFNFMRLWDGHQLAQWFPIEPRELRKDFLAYILSCTDNIVHIPKEVSSKIKDLPGKMMDCKLQEVAASGDKLIAENQLAITVCPELVTSAESPNEYTCYFNLHWNPIREAPATSSAPDPSFVSSDFLSTCHRVTSDGDGVLHIAARSRNVALVHDIWENHGTLATLLVSTVNNRGDTILHCASAGGSDAIVKLFLENMGSAMFLRAQNLKGETCLHEAVRHGHAGIVKTLILTDSRIPYLGRPTLMQIVDNAGISPLYLATTLRRIEIVRALTKKTYRQDDKDAASCSGPARKTALHAAVVLLDKEMIAVLLDWNAGLTSQEDESGSTPLHFLASLSLERTEPNSLVRVLYLWHLQLRALTLSLALFCLEGMEPNSMQRVTIMMNKLYNIYNSVFNPLHWVIIMVLHMYKRAQDSGVLYRPLQYSEDNDYKFVQDSGTIELILRKDPLSALYVDSTGSLPIHIAAAHRRLDTVKKLLKECPCCCSSRNAAGQTFLHLAVEKEKLEIVDYVCRAQKFNRILNTEDQDGNTALHLAVKNASEKIFCTLMRNKEVCLNFANKDGHTPLDLAFLSLHPKEKRMQGSREWIFFDLLHGGGDFGVCSWGHLARNVVEADWDKESESVSKSASMMAVCAVLILNASLMAPFQVLSHNQKENSLAFHGARFQAFVLFDTLSFVCSAAATYFCACAGFTMSDGSTRLKNLITGTYALVLAALTWICAVALALFLVLPVQTWFRPIIVGGMGVFACMLFLYARSKLFSVAFHLRAVGARVGSISKLAFLLLLGRSAVKPLWVVPSPSIVLFLSLGAGLVVFLYQLPLIELSKKM